ncbi:MAG: P-II family nitrogen regulator [Gemmatimonadota bacterium]
MKDLVEIRAIVRLAMLDRVVHQLKEAGAPRLAVTRVHAIGAGADPAKARFSLEDGSAYAEKAQVSLICARERNAMYVELICKAARTGRRGDGIVSVHPVLDVTKVRTGVAGPEALS